MTTQLQPARYNLPPAVEQGLSAPRLVLLNELPYGSVPPVPHGIFVGAVRGQTTAGNEVIRVFVYECAAKRVAILADLSPTFSPTNLTGFNYANSVVAVAPGWQPNYAGASVEYSQPDGTVIGRYGAMIQPRDAVIYTNNAVLSQAPDLRISRIVLDPLPRELPLPANAPAPETTPLVYELMPPFNPMQYRYPDALPWQASSPPDGPGYDMCVYAIREKIDKVPELEYLQGVDFNPVYSTAQK